MSLRLPEPECAEKFCIRFADVVLIGGGISAAVELVLGAALVAIAWLATREPGRRGASWWLSAFAPAVLWLAALRYAISAFLN